MPIKVKLNRGEIARFLRSRTMTDAITKAGSTIAGRCGAGFESRVHVGSRARATVMSVTPDAVRRQSRDHTIERAVGGGL